MRAALLGKLSIVLGVALFGATLFSLFLPLNEPDLPAEIVGATTLVAFAMFVVAMMLGE